MSTTHSIGIAEMIVVQAPDQIRSVLGSCVGVTLVDRSNKIGGMAHVILPDSSEGSGDPGKFADSAVELLLESMLAAGATRGRICAKMVGGAQMFGAASQNGLGERNIDAVRKRLKKHMIPINAEDCGGKKGRKITLDPATGDLQVQIIGKESRTI